MTAAVLVADQSAMASGGGDDIVNLTRSSMGVLALVLFAVAYAVAIMEENHFRKSCVKD